MKSAGVQVAVRTCVRWAPVGAPGAQYLLHIGVFRIYDRSVHPLGERRRRYSVVSHLYFSSVYDQFTKRTARLASFFQIVDKMSGESAWLNPTCL